MNRFSQSRGDHIEYSAWVVADAQGGLRLVRGQPDTARGEVAVSMTFRLPKSLFRKPLLRAEVHVPEMAPLSKDEAIQAVVAAISGSDFDVDVRAVS